MTQLPNQNPFAYNNAPAAPSESSNGIGLAGFIVSLASIITCGIAAPIGLLLSIIGLFKNPKGFAIAGTIIGALLSLFGLLVGIGMVAGFMGLKTAGGVMQQGLALGLGEQEIQKFYTQNNRLPSEQEFDQLLTASAGQIPGLFGGSGNFQVTYRYEMVDATTVRLTFPGFDGQMDTGDDLSELIEAAAGSVQPPPMPMPPSAPAQPAPSAQP
ncbi:MAG: hypothetical protein IT445_20995 [Phycisphaeraceae bacterium]|nr:hypothetical protein [Phycisphaeraceae bacterium]